MGAISCGVRTPLTPNASAGELVFEVFVPSFVSVNILEMSFVARAGGSNAGIRLVRTTPGVGVTYDPFISDEDGTTGLGGIVSVWAQKPVIPLSWVADVRRTSTNSSASGAGTCWTFPRGLVLNSDLSLTVFTAVTAQFGVDLSVTAEV